MRQRQLQTEESRKTNKTWIHTSHFSVQLKPFATRNTFCHLTLSFLHDLPFSRTRHGTHQSAITSESTHQIGLKWLVFCTKNPIGSEFASGLVWGYVQGTHTRHTQPRSYKCWYEVHIIRTKLFLNFKCWCQEKMEGITKNPDVWNFLGYISLLFPSSPQRKIMDYLSSQASLASFLLHGRMQITRRCNLENHVKKTGTQLDWKHNDNQTSYQ